MNDDARCLTTYLWKLKIPLKIKIFMWFLNKKVLLTRDNLAKRNWNGSKKCCFCDSEETVNHLFISCPFDRLVWRIIFATYDIPPPTNITNMFRNWLNGIDNKTKAKFVLAFQLYVGQYEIVEMILCSTGRTLLIFAGYPYGCTLDPAMVFPFPGG